MDLAAYRARLYALLSLEEEDARTIARGLQGELLEEYRKVLAREMEEIKKEIDRINHMI